MYMSVILNNDPMNDEIGSLFENYKPRAYVSYVREFFIKSIDFDIKIYITYFHQKQNYHEYT